MRIVVLIGSGVLTTVGSNPKKYIMNTLDIVKDRQQQISVVALNGIMALRVNGAMG